MGGKETEMEKEQDIKFISIDITDKDDLSGMKRYKAVIDIGGKKKTVLMQTDGIFRQHRTEEEFVKDIISEVHRPKEME